MMRLFTFVVQVGKSRNVLLKGFVLIVLACSMQAVSAQKVGLVLSGGGASGMVHIGVMKALEENGIPIDYITGTSMGALIGAMYAIGYSPQQIDSLFCSDLYRLMSEGGIEPQYEHFFQKPESDASLISLKFFTDTAITTSLPTNLRDPVTLDLEMMLSCAPASAISKGNMDSLFVPFRCVASDVEDKKSVVFKDGDLAQAVRASMSYPFYFKTIKVNGHLMFDGGLYNNFPSDVMRDEFAPDFMIGSNVSYNDGPPSEDDIISQIKAIMVDHTDYSIPDGKGIMIEPITETGLFDFSDPKQAIEDGYNAAIAQMDDIKQQVKRHEHTNAVATKRAEFSSKKPPLFFDKIRMNGLNRSQSKYTNRIFSRKKDKLVSVELLKRRYFRAYGDKNLKDMFPIAVFDEEKNAFDLNIQAKREKDMEVRFGGVFSSRPINTGFVGINYRLFHKASTMISANSYFGKFYGSLHGKIRLDLSTRLPIYFEPQITVNRWDYFRSFSTFFEEARPSYIVLQEIHTGANIGLSLGSKGHLRLDGKYAQLDDEYYQTDQFTNTDTADVTRFNNGNFGIRLERNSLNRKDYANAGGRYSASLRYVNGNEQSIPGSTSDITEEFKKERQWLQLKVEVDKYFNRTGWFKFGGHFSAVYSDQPFFNNYTASIVRAPAFEPIPEARTRVMDEFRAHQYLAGGVRTVATFKKNFDVRLEAFIFQPIKSIERTENDKAKYSKEFAFQYYIGSGTVLWNSPLGPVALSVNYFEEQNDPWSLIFSFGYSLFNQKVWE